LPERPLLVNIKPLDIIKKSREFSAKLMVTKNN